MALYRTDPYHTICYRMHAYRTVRYRTVLKSKPIRHLREDHGKTTIYRTVGYNTVRHHGRYVGARCTVRDKLREQIYFAAAFGHKHTHSFGIKLSCKFATRFCQLLANLLCCQDLFKVCDNKYGDKSPCFIAGSLVVKSYLPICVLVVRVNHASNFVEVRFILKPRLSFFIFVLNLRCQGFMINVEISYVFLQVLILSRGLSHRAI